MRALVRYVFFCALVVGIAWVSVSVQIKGRTPLTHLREQGGQKWWDEASSWIDNAKTRAIAQWATWTENDETPPPPPVKKKQRKRRAPRRADPKPRELRPQAEATRRVALLREAAQDAAPPKKSGQKTQIDRPIQQKDRNALDRVIAGHRD